MFGQGVLAGGGPNHRRRAPLRNARIAGPGKTPGIASFAIAPEMPLNPLIALSGQGSLGKSAFCHKEVLVEVLQMLALAQRFVDEALSASPDELARDTERLKSVQREIRSAMLLARDQLS